MLQPASTDQKYILDLSRNQFSQGCGTIAYSFSLKNKKRWTHFHFKLTQTPMQISRYHKIEVWTFSFSFQWRERFVKYPTLKNKQRL